MMDKPTMVYVAVNPSQPDAAWALCVDKPEFAKHTAKELAKWARGGAAVMRVDMDTAREMLRKWVKVRKAGDAAQESLL